MPIKVYRRDGGKVWHYRGTVDGRRLRGSTRTTDKDVAQRIVAEKEVQAWKRRLDGPAAVLTFAQASALYRKAGKPTRHLAKVEDHWKDTPVRDINVGAIKHACRELFPGAAPATWNRQVIVPTQAVINHAAENDLCPAIRVERFKVPKVERGHATSEWIDAFMAHASPPVAALACFMFMTGARITEALSVTWQDVDLAEGKVLIRSTKIGEERWARLPPRLVAAIANIEGDRVGRVFRYTHRDTAKAPWMAAVKAAGIVRLTPHACRHGFATTMLHKGIDPVTVAKLGGWKSPAHVFATYGHPNRDPGVIDRVFDPPVTRTVGEQDEKDSASTA